MQTKAANPNTLIQTQQAHPFIQAYFEFNQLKQLYRQGWLQRGISETRCETVAEHCFSMAVLALFIAEAHFPQLDSLKVIRLCLLHDFGEIYAGDFTPKDKISSEEKYQLERQSITQVFSKLPNGQVYIELWEEFEHGQSAEAKFVRQIDRLEFRLQAKVYQKQGLIDANEWFAGVYKTIVDEDIKAILTELEAL